MLVATVIVSLEPVVKSTGEAPVTLWSGVAAAAIAGALSFGWRRWLDPSAVPSLTPPTDAKGS